MDAVKSEFSAELQSIMNGRFCSNKRWFSASDELKRKGGYTQYNDSFARIGKYIQASEVGRFHFYCAACEADFSLAKMGPRAVERHVQSTRHKKIVAALATNPHDLSDPMSPLTSAEAASVSTTSCSNRNLFLDINTSTSMEIFDVRRNDSMSGVCAPLQSLLQNVQMACKDVTQIKRSNDQLDDTENIGSITRCGGTANIISGPEADLSLGVKKEYSVTDRLPDNGHEIKNSEKNDPNNSYIHQESNLPTSFDGQPSAGGVADVRVSSSVSAVSSFLHDTSSSSISSEKEQQLFLLKAEILQMKKKMMKLKCEYYRKKIALVEMMKQNNFCSS